MQPGLWAVVCNQLQLLLLVRPTTAMQGSAAEQKMLLLHTNLLSLGKCRCWLYHYCSCSAKSSFKKNLARDTILSCHPPGCSPQWGLRCSGPGEPASAMPCPAGSDHTTSHLAMPRAPATGTWDLETAITCKRGNDATLLRCCLASLRIPAAQAATENACSLRKTRQAGEGALNRACPGSSLCSGVTAVAAGGESSEAGPGRASAPGQAAGRRGGSRRREPGRLRGPRRRQDGERAAGAGAGAPGPGCGDLQGQTGTWDPPLAPGRERGRVGTDGSCRGQTAGVGGRQLLPGTDVQTAPAVHSWPERPAGGELLPAPPASPPRMALGGLDSTVLRLLRWCYSCLSFLPISPHPQWTVCQH